MLKQTLWYIVMNNHEARILRDLRNSHDPDHEETVLGGDERHMRDVLRDRPARSFASFGGGRRSAVEPASDPLAEDSRQFLRDMFHFLEKRQAAGAFDGLILIGAADIIGLWREMVPQNLHRTVQRQYIKNLVGLPSKDIVPAVRDLTIS